MVRRPESEETSADGASWRLVPENLEIDLRRAAVGGGLAFLVTLLGALLVGEVSGAEAITQLDLALDSTRALCQTVIIATATILALMLTLLGVSASTEQDLRWEHYVRVRQIAWIDSVALIGAVLIFLLLNVPLEEAGDLAAPLPSILYYATLILASLMGGALISVVLMLYNTVRDVIEVIGDHGADKLVVEREQEREE